MYDQFLFLIALLLLVAAYCDFRWMKIPNALSVIVLGLFLIEFTLSPASVMPIEPRLWSAGMMFVVTFILFVLGILGAGDSKLLTVLGFWLPLKVLVPFIFFMAIFGAVLSVASLILMRTKSLRVCAEHSVWIKKLHEGKGAVPYGVAIALGYICVYFLGLI